MSELSPSLMIHLWFHDTDRLVITRRDWWYLDFVNFIYKTSYALFEILFPMKRYCSFVFVAKDMKNVGKSRRNSILGNRKFCKTRVLRHPPLVWDFARSAGSKIRTVADENSYNPLSEFTNFFVFNVHTNFNFRLFRAAKYLFKRIIAITLIWREQVSIPELSIVILNSLELHAESNQVPLERCSWST